MLKNKLRFIIILTFIIVYTLTITTCLADSTPEDLDSAIIISDDTIIVFSYADLNTILSTKNNFTYIYLGNNITAASSGIAIHNSKSSVVIDGHPPDAPANVNYTFEQADSNDLLDTIFLNNENNTTKHITLQNLVLKGNNSQGIVFIPESLSGVTISYKQVVYTGPQVVTNHKGIVEFIDCEFMMSRSTGDTMEELAEANHIKMGGEITIGTNASEQVLNSVLLITSDNPHLSILENAIVRVNIVGYFLDIDIESPHIIIHPDAEFDIRGDSGFTPPNKNVGSMIISTNAMVRITQSSPQTRGTLLIEKHFEMQPDSSLLIVRTSMDGSPIIFPEENACAIFNQPYRVMLLSPNRGSFTFEKSGHLEIITESINTWEQDMMGAFNKPAHIWNNRNNKPLSLVATYENGQVATFEHSLTNDAPITSPLTSEAFNFPDTDQLTFGKIRLMVNPIFDSSETISGISDNWPGYDTIITTYYDTIDGESITKSTATLANSSFSIDLDGKTLAPNQDITVITTLNSLERREILRHEVPGYLTFQNVSSTIDFASTAIPSEPTIVNRANESTFLTVVDNRLTRQPWRIDANITKPLTATYAGTTLEIPNALIFVDEFGTARKLSATPLTIYQETTSLVWKSYIDWAPDQGILLNIVPGNIYSNVTYSATIQFSLIDAP